MMISVLSIILVLLVAYIWLLRGFLSALIHFLCTLIAGAVAFALWEPASLWLLKDATATGFVASSAWAIGLAFPFAITLLIVRPLMDRIIRNNVSVDPKVDYAGGAILGAASGIISVGILTISLSYLRVNYLGAKSFQSGATGNVERSGGLWVPFDKMTIATYGFLSERAFKTREPLARWRPAAFDQGNANRISPFENKGRNTFRPDDFQVRSRFTVGEGSSNFSALTSDRWDSNPQQVADPDGNPYPAGTYVEGFVVTFMAGAKEKDGQAAVGNSQVQLMIENDAGERKMVFPFAVASQADPRTPGVARWRYNAQDVFIASVGGASESIFAFEFPCPPGFKPYALYIKGIRHRVDQGATAAPAQKFASASERDAGLATFGMGQLTDVFTRTEPAKLNAEGAEIIGDGRAYVGGMPQGISPNIRIPWNITLQLGSHGQLQLLEEGTKNIISGGEITIAKSELTRVLEKGIQIQYMAVDPTTVLVQMEVSPSSRTSLLGGAVNAAENVLPPLLVDTLGQTYQPVGYAYEDEQIFKLRFEPGEPIRAMSQLPSLSRSRPAQKMVLFFRVSLGREVRAFQKGGKTIYEFNPPFKLETPQQQTR